MSDVLVHTECFCGHQDDDCYCSESPKVFRTVYKTDVFSTKSLIAKMLKKMGFAVLVPKPTTQETAKKLILKLFLDKNINKDELNCIMVASNFVKEEYMKDLKSHLRQFLLNTYEKKDENEKFKGIYLPNTKVFISREELFPEMKLKNRMSLFKKK